MEGPATPALRVPDFDFQALGDVWVLTNANDSGGSPVWAQLHPKWEGDGNIQPGARFYSTAVRDPGTNSMIIFGGRNRRGRLFPTLGAEPRQRALKAAIPGYHVLATQIHSGNAVGVSVGASIAEQEPEGHKSFAAILPHSMEQGWSHCPGFHSGIPRWHGTEPKRFWPALMDAGGRIFPRCLALISLRSILLFNARFPAGTASWERRLRAGGTAGFCFPATRDPPGLRSPKKQNDKAKFVSWLPHKKHPLTLRAGPTRPWVSREKRGRKGEKP